ncbi:MAG: hypothetical protein ACJAV1_000718 [Paraglaciecola sp.]|jgi:hypothetical protein
MANFQAHFTAATITSSLAASTALSLQLADQKEVVVLWFLGLIGGMLPDIDSNDSTSVRLIFKLFGIAVALGFAMWLSPIVSVIGLWLIGSVIYCAVRYGLLPLFEKVTVHRGSIHSLLSCTMFGLASVHMSLLCSTSIVFAWCTGVFIMMGMLTHLTLDEIYSVNLADMQFKRSFGTALKLLSLDYPLATGAQVIACIALVYYSPSLEPFITALQRAEFHFLPMQEWAALKKLVSS